MAVMKPTHTGPEDEIIFCDEYGVRRAQNLSYTPNFNSVENSEIGALGVLESVPDTITTSVTLDTNDWGSTDTLQLILGEKAAVPYASGVVNSGVFTENDFENAVVDFVVAIREDTTLRRSRLLPNQYLSGFDWNYSVDGVASENYSFSGSMDHEFGGAYADLRSLRGAFASANGVSVTSGFHVSGAYGTGYTAYHVTVDNKIVATGGQITLTTTGTQTRVTMSNVTNLASGSRFRLVLYKDTAATFAARQSAAGVNVPGYAAVMGRQVEIYLGDSNLTLTESDKALRVQSVGIKAELNRNDIKELGNQDVIGKELEIPIKINADVAFLENDLESYAKMIGGASWTAWTGYQANPTSVGVHLTPDMLPSNMTLVVKVFKERSSHTTELKRITMSGLSATGKPGQVGVGQRATITFNLQGSYITVSGTNNSPLA